MAYSQGYFKELSEIIFKPLASISDSLWKLGKYQMTGNKVIEYQYIKKGTAQI